ncbi:multiple sugar transport system substrate-binding protein [Butyrivibrio fibrisolvens DSM 3071]|jgi:multiple sugar transport system substrate-binding protein/putative aldouronate transport system substrate-binding protein|uniref:Multiple sugar transport system substrate-binding protein n=1 Tax=Butyrivibrio fibrisolvens DSM 3071 TaxID=1121131 RepID=A0A1M5Z3S4_BUTFI|nr:extracellular solute-binding protein [Butyrivibrio fibrisolvens]SHI18922.1 multiple sugar transport system substrate-binding protein [Butyrivibrio fibrisolvens DSM 3071]
MKKRLLSTLILTSTLFLLSGCAGRNSQKYPEELTIDVFASGANSQGIQSGWFAECVKERFNMNLNIISVNNNYNGAVLQDVRAASGYLGDIIMISAQNNSLKDLVDSGLLLDMTPYIQDKDIMKYSDAIYKLNSGLDGIYAIPSSISTLPPDTPSDIINSTYAPYVRWDIYTQIGSPKMDTLEDMLDVLEKMQEANPLSDSGQKVYAFSFFDDWDNNMMTWAKQPCCFYGYDENGFVLAKADGSDYQSILDDNSLYYRALKLYFEANQRGLVDPDSRNQSYSEVFSKYQDGAVLFSPWRFLGMSAYNTDEHMQEGKGFMMADIGDMQIYEHGCSLDGVYDIVMCVGADVKDPQRMVDFVDYIYSDDGVYENQAAENGGSAGPYGITWTITDGKPELTEYGIDVFYDQSSAVIPDDPNGNTYRGGISMLNYTAVSLTEIADNGYPYAYELWESEMNRTSTKLMLDWSNAMGADNTMDYLVSNNKLIVSPGCEYNESVESAEIKEIREAVKRIIISKSWEMIYAKDEQEFEDIWNDMKSKCQGLGYADVYAFDLQNAMAEGDLKKEILGR